MLLAVTLAFALLSPQAAAPAPRPSESPAAQPTPAAPDKPPCRNPDTSGKYHIGCGVTAPIVTHNVVPEYPEEARAKKLSPSGFAIALTVDADGSPIDVHVKNSRVDNVDKDARQAEQLLEDNMVEAVKQYKFKPATFQGKPVPVELIVEIFID